MRRSTLALSLSASFLGFATPALAQNAPTSVPTPVAEDQADADAQSTAGDPGAEIVITGSRLGGRTIADSPVPVDVIGGEQLQNSGATETNRLLNQIVPSFNFPQPSLTDGTDSLRPATLRGLAPDQTLVLVNGKRRHQAALLNLNGSVGRGSGAVDLNEIPPIAIDRIEVLRDGASSLYGSDAIAGVINIQLSRREGARGSITYGQNRTTMEDVYDVLGVQTNAAGQPVVAFNGGTNRTNDLFALNQGEERERHDGDTLTLASSIGLPMGDSGFLVFSSQFRDRQPTNRSGADPRRQYFVPNTAAATTVDARELSVNRFNHRYGDGETQDFNLFYNAGTNIGDVELYTFGSYGIRDGNGAGFFRRSTDARNRNFSVPTTTAAFTPFFADGFLPIINSEIEDKSFAVGAKTEFLTGWNADLSVVYGGNSLDYRVTDSFNVSLGAGSPLGFDAGGLAFSQVVGNLDVTHNFDVDFVNRIGIAIGGEARRERFKIRAGDLASYVNGPFVAAGAPGGAQVFPGFRPSNVVNETRESYAGYVELDSEVSDRLSVQLAGRYEHYTDFGDTLNGKAAARLELFPGVAIRGSVSTGFRAPSLAQQFFNTTSTNNVAGVLIDILTVPVSNPIARALGARDLEPEKAVNFGGGITVDPIPGFNVTADYYQIRIRDRIVLTENLQGNAVTALLLQNGITGVSSARFFVNGVDTKTEGVDVVATYRVPDMGFGNLRLTAGFNYNEQSITDRATLPSLPGLILYGRAESLRLTNGQPKSKINMAVDYDAGPVSATVRTNRYGTVLSAGGSTNLAAAPSEALGDYYLPPRWIWDLEARVQATKAIQLAIGADNIFDTYPRRAPFGPPGSAFGINGAFLAYSSLSPFGFNGRYLYGRVSVNF